MGRAKAFTLIEILLVLVIVGILAAIAIPNLRTSIEQTNAQTAQNNLYAVAGAQSRYYEEFLSYCTVTMGSVIPCGDTNANLNTNLHLQLGTAGDSFSYSCSSVPAAGGCSVPTYQCTATDPTDTLTLTVKMAGCSVIGGTVSCAPVGPFCPS